MLCYNRQAIVFLMMVSCIWGSLAEAKTVFVTGANRGQGLGWVKYYAAAGDTVIATCRKPEAAEELQALANKYDSVRVEALDVVDEASIAAMGRILSEQDVVIDLAINNAGVTDEEHFGEWTKKSFEFNIGVNTIGPALVTQMLDPHLQQGSIVVNISSGVASIANQSKSNSLDAYGLSKAGLNYITKRLAVKMKDRGVILVSMTPGSVLTDMNPAGWLSVEDAIERMVSTIDGLTIEDSGNFISNKGRVIAW